MASKMQKAQPFIQLLSKYVKCTGCRKLFTQTIYKKKKSIPICPYCKKLN